MNQKTKKETLFLTPDNKAAAINLALFLDLIEFDECALKMFSLILNESEKRLIFDFWRSLTVETYRVWLCVADYEGRL